ncbi:hypothetical protein RJ639_000953 [Escallonia herrerae]|uniref:SOSEKI DIX-like domain-containing protein n=1 Tax=Escallonia herrerae TaxID=1293975 RepID=A0AA89BT73_9ASTE|nr:hypothetical protein RJ639_000953 [Escallonia herrerae]
MEEVRGGRRYRETSPERAKVSAQLQPRVAKPTPTFRKVQVVYYLSRNGQLEHPHFMEVTHLAHHQLRLKDVMDRLIVLRGKGMPSLYSWSCKRSYKNGYVWNDLSENDIIHSTEGAEYVLKGCEFIEGCADGFQQLQVGNRQEVQDPVFHQRRKQPASKRHPVPEEVGSNRYTDHGDENDEEEDQYEEKPSYNTPNTPHSRCSRGCSTDEIELLHHESTQKNPSAELSTQENSSPPSTTSSSVSDKANESINASKRFEDGDLVSTESLLSRNSVLLQLIACGGGSVSFRGKSAPVAKEPPARTSARKSSSLHRGVLCKATAAAKVVVEEDEMISCMSENPRLGNLQGEEKEYFSGSIVESMSEERAQVEPALKKSSSYNEERSSKASLGEAAQEEDEEMKTEKSVKGKCIPRKKSSSKQSKK